MPVCLLVTPDIIELGKNEQHNAQRRQGKQDLVSRAVKGLVFITIDLLESAYRSLAPGNFLAERRKAYIVGYDVRDLDRHVIKCCSDGSRPDGTRVS